MDQFDFHAHDQIVQWMRNNGVITLEIHGLKIQLGPAPRDTTQPQTEEQRHSEEMSKRRRELDILFSASSVRPRQT